jgi:hypothetical protein
MPLDQGLLKGTQSREWVVAKPPSGASPQWVYTGRDESGLGPIYVALTSISAPPSRETMRALHAAYKGKSNIQLVVGAVLGNQVWIFGPDEKTDVTEPLALDQGCRQLQSALDEPDAIAAYTRLGQFRRSLDTTSLVGVTNSGLFASYHIRENVPKRNDWKESCEKAKPLLALRNEHLIKALGFKSEKTAGNALLLTTGTPQSKAVAILLDETEQFDATSARHTGISPVAFGLNIAARQGVPWLFVLRKDQIRIYPAKDGVGVGQKGQVETYLEIDLAAIDSERAGLLSLIFSADALEPNGTANDLLKGSQLFASQLSSRLRERIYEHVVPQLSKSVAEHLRDQGTNLDSEGLSLAYRLTLRILFRLLFQAYAEDRGLLPAGRNEGYDANSLKTIAKRIINTPPEQFGKSKTLWFDLVQVWDAIDEGNETWNVPAYNGGLFGTDPTIHPEGALIEKLGIQDDILGLVLQHLLLDISEENVLGPVDFRSLSVREFGTIYEGLLESSLSVANEDLTVDAKGAWIPTTTSSQVLVKKGEVYFHSASGERKATGSYFTPSVVVDHLIERSLNPALDSHLEKIRGYLEAGDQALAARQFFDFRVVDLAMGSGHFLVAAVDRIEAKMRTFLAEKETQIPGINAELQRLSRAAKEALGNDESAIGEIEPAALLRRQIARRCIYGLDINPLAVELSRLALWIHTFVPGLPMSSLDHGLVCANSLTGIGTIQEALDALQPGNTHGNNLGGRWVEMTTYETAITDNLTKAEILLLEVANSDEAKKSEVKAAATVAARARLASEPAREMFNAAVAARLGLFDPRNIFDEVTLLEIGRRKDISDVVASIKPAHMPFLFPEVFLRTRPGFDVVLGNPPWEELMLEEPKFWLKIRPGLLGLSAQLMKSEIQKLRDQYPDLVNELEKQVQIVSSIRKTLLSGPYPGLGTGDVDLYQAFAWRNWQLLRDGGYFGLVTPRSLLNGAGSTIWREEVFQNSDTRIATLTNSGKWIFPSVHAQYSISLVCSKKTLGSSNKIGLSGPFDNETDFVNPKNDYGFLAIDLLKSASTGMTIPQLPDSQSVEVFSIIRNSPRFDESLDFELRPVAEFHATNERSIFDSGTEKDEGAWKVLGGAGFNLWQPLTGEIYAWADSKKSLDYLQNKRKNQSRTRSSAFYGLENNDIKDNSTLAANFSRVAFRDVTNAIDYRTVIAALIPPKTFLLNSAPYLMRIKGSTRDEAFVLGVLSSMPLDWYARRFVVLHVNFHIFNGLPIPIFEKNDNKYERIVSLVAGLTSINSDHNVWLDSLGIDFNKIESEEDRFAAQSEIDALVAIGYGLNEVEVGHIFRTFHKTWDYRSRLEKVLNYFEQWKRD